MGYIGSNDSFSGAVKRVALNRVRLERVAWDQSRTAKGETSARMG